jgi:hypothetical protein
MRRVKEPRDWQTYRDADVMVDRTKGETSKNRVRSQMSVETREEKGNRKARHVDDKYERMEVSCGYKIRCT